MSQKRVEHRGFPLQTGWCSQPQTLGPAGQVHGTDRRTNTLLLGLNPVSQGTKVAGATQKGAGVGGHSLKTWHVRHPGKDTRGAGSAGASCRCAFHTGAKVALPEVALLSPRALGTQCEWRACGGQGSCGGQRQPRPPLRGRPVGTVLGHSLSVLTATGI